VPCGVTNDTLTAMFERYGAVMSARVSTDRDTGRSKGFGFVEMGSDPQALAAIKGINGREVEGHRLTVNEARPEEGGCRSAYSGGGGGRSGFGGGGYTGDFAIDHPVVDRPSPEADGFEPVAVIDVVREPHPVAHTVLQPGGADTGAGEELLQDALPSICEAAGRVGGFKRLSEIAGQLGQYDEGQ
jgi:hypothetical protein